MACLNIGLALQDIYVKGGYIVVLYIYPLDETFEYLTIMYVLLVFSNIWLR